MKKLNKFKGMYALLVAVAAVIGITIYGSCSADEDFWGFDDEYTSTENTRSEAKDVSEYLTLSTYEPNKWTDKDRVILGKAFLRLTIQNDDGLSYVQETKVGGLNMSEELFNFIKNGFEYGNKLLRENNYGQTNKKKQISRRKTRDPEGSIHNCTGNDCVGHSIAYYLHRNLEEVNNIIKAKLPTYPDSIVPKTELEATLDLFKPFVRQTTFFPDNAIMPYPIPGIILIPYHALNGIYISNYNNGFTITCYDDQTKYSPIYYVPTKQCATSPSNVSYYLFGYYK